MSSFTGGCLCGGVRYAFDAYFDAGYCHCDTCRRWSGGPVLAWARVGADHLLSLDGTLTAHSTSTDGERCFCPTCGSALLFRPGGGEWVQINLGTLDDPALIAPRVHMCVERQLPWLELDDLLPAIEGDQLPLPEQRRPLRADSDPTVTRESELTLRELRSADAVAVLLLHVAGNQRRFVASNAISLAQALFEERAWYRGIYAGDTAVGFVMLRPLEHDLAGLPSRGDPFLWRFMIDVRYQHLGFGSRALKAVVDNARDWGEPSAFWLSCERGTGSPYDFYLAAGFTDTGATDPDGERILYLPYEGRSRVSTHEGRSRVSK